MDKTILNSIPNKPGIYLFKNTSGKKDKILYIGKAKNLKNRVSQYFNPNSVRKQDMLNKADTVDFLQVKTESEALYLEDNLIKEHQPPFNNMLKGSNSYAYIKITKEDFPQIIITRNKINDGSKYIGPKHNTRELKNFLQYLRYIIKRRGCKKTQFNQGKLCGDYHFGLCKGRCMFKNKTQSTSSGACEGSSKQGFKMDSSFHSEGQITTQQEAITEYKSIIKIIEQFFKGNTRPVEKEIKLQIQSAIDAENFERAAKLRDIYLQIENLTEKQTVVLPKSISGYVCQIREISGWFVYIVLNFYEGKLIDVIINKQNINDVDEYSILSSLESDLGKLSQIEKLDTQFFATAQIKINKTQTQDLLSLIDGFLDSYLVSESFKDENLINNMLDDLKTKYKLKNFPYHIECIDISHLSGSWTSGGLSGFLGGIANYKLYRKYKIENKINLEKNKMKGGDDYEALKEVIIRRFKPKDDLSSSSASEGYKNIPDLFILDGGKGQLGILRDLLKNQRFQDIFKKTDFVSLGKGVARKTAGKLQGEKEKIFYFDADMKIQSIDLEYDQSDRILIKIRDEAHRFSNSYRKYQMKKDF